METHASCMGKKSLVAPTLIALPLSLWCATISDCANSVLELRDVPSASDHVLGNDLKRCALLEAHVDVDVVG